MKGGFTPAREVQRLTYLYIKVPPLCYVNSSVLLKVKYVCHLAELQKLQFKRIFRLLRLPQLKSQIQLLQVLVMACLKR